MTEKAIFAAGCFWGVQYYFDQVPGVISTTVGYIGGKTSNPSYEDVCYKDTGHAEAVEIVFDPKKVSFSTLLKQFFHMHDPTTLNRQGPDVGDQYRSEIFYTTKEQKELTEANIKELQSSFTDPIVTKVTEADKFWPAEEYHQKFTEKTGRGMCHVPYQPM
jgi:peptide methionine sulfoxide reductase msrA/msrB